MHSNSNSISYVQLPCFKDLRKPTVDKNFFTNTHAGSVRENSLQLVNINRHRLYTGSILRFIFKTAAGVKTRY